MSNSEYAPLWFIRPPWLWLVAAAFSEFLGGIAIGLGFLTRVGAFFIAYVMITAIAVVHLPAFCQMLLLAMTISLIVFRWGQLSMIVLP